MIIDAWAQQPTLRHSQSPIFESLRRWTKTPVPTEPSPVSDLIASMDMAGIDVSLISAWQSPKYDLITNDEVAAFVAEAPDRLIGVGSVDVSKPSAVFGEVQRCIKELRFKAIRVLPWLAECPPTDRRFYPVYTVCAELGVPFCTQIGHTGPLMPSEVGRPIYLDQVALDFPNLTIVAGHIGFPWTEEAIAVATKHENVFIDTSAYTVRRYPEPLINYLKGHGRGKVLFGSNYPMLTHLKALDGLEALGLSDEIRADFLGRTAQRIFEIGV